MSKMNMKWLTEQQVDRIYYEGSWNTGDGGFDFQAFAEAVQAEIGRQLEEAARMQCTCAIEGSPCNACRERTGYGRSNA